MGSSIQSLGCRQTVLHLGKLYSSRSLFLISWPAGLEGPALVLGLPTQMATKTASH